MTAIENAQIKALSEKIAEQNTKIAEKNEQIVAVKSSVERIEIALLGDEFNPDLGLVKRVKDIEAKQSKQDDLYKKLIWTASIIGAIFLIVEVVFQVTGIIEFFTSHKH